MTVIGRQRCKGVAVALAINPYLGSSALKYAPSFGSHSWCTFPTSPGSTSQADLLGRDSRKPGVDMPIRVNR